jgi:hypothetical protein
VCPTGCAAADVFRPGLVSLEYTYWNGFVSDTITTHNLTVTLGLRYDNQYGSNTASTVSGNPLFPNLVPGKVYNGSEKDFTWETFQPRVGVNYALGQERKTLLRASYARYADQLGGSIVSWNNPVGGAGTAGSRYVWTDRNGDHNVQPGELGAFIQDLGGFNHLDPNALGSANVIDPNLKAPLTDEFQLSVDHEIFPEFTASLTGTFRHRNKIVWSPYIGATAASYTNVFATGLPGYDVNGNVLGVTGPIYTGTLGADFNGGEFVTNRPDYSQDYYGAQLQVTKRLTNNWLMHGSFAYNDWKQNIDNKQTACIDPTNQRLYQDPAFSAGFPTPNVGPSCSEGQLYNQSLGSGNFTNVWINSHWSFNVSGMYQFPLAFALAANFYGRQGYVNPYFIQIDSGNGEGNRGVLLGDPTDHRLNDVYELDLRLEKAIPLFGKADLTISAELFNALNSNTVLQRQSDATPQCDNTGHNCTGAAGTILEIQNARAVRLGARISF